MNIIGADEYLTICQKCGCGFDYQYAYKYNKENKIGISTCPACKHEYETFRNDKSN